MSQRSCRGVKILSRGPRDTPARRSWLARVTWAAPSRRLRAICTTERFSTGSRKDPRTPLVERAHRRTAPDLVIGAPGLVTGAGPLGAHEKIPAEDKRHLVFGILVRPFDLTGVAALEERLRVGPDVVDRPPEHLLFQNAFLPVGDRVEARVGAVRLVELLTPLSEKRPPLEHLHFDTQLEHVGGRSHRDVRGRRGREQRSAVR